MDKRAVPNLCKHCYFRDCPYCLEDTKIIDYLYQTITLLSYTTGLFVGRSMKFNSLDDDDRKQHKINMKLANEARDFIDSLAKPDTAASDV